MPEGPPTPDLLRPGMRKFTSRPAVMAIVALTAAVLAFALVSSLRGPSVAAQQAALQSYLRDLEPIAVDAGRVLELNVKPALDELEARQPAPGLARRAQDWRRQLDGIGDRLAALQPPGEVTAANDLFREAIAGYSAIANDVAVAANQQRAQRASVAAAARKRGADTDEVWDAGARLIQERRAALSMPKVAWLPG